MYTGGICGIVAISKQFFINTGIVLDVTVHVVSMFHIEYFQLIVIVSYEIMWDIPYTIR